MGEAPDSIIVVESPEDVARLQVPDPERIAFVTQTTLSIYDANRVITALKARFPNIKAPPKEDICYATTNRQNAVSQLSDEVDLVLVVGSRNSSNSLRLVETAREQGKEAHLIDDQSEMDPAWLDNKESILVTAGAVSAERLVQGLLERLQGQWDATVEVKTLVEEDVTFAPPKSLRSLAVVA